MVVVDYNCDFVILCEQEHLDWVLKWCEKSGYNFSIGIGKSGLEVIKPLKYRLGISFLYLTRVPETELEKAKWVNFHPAPLPKYGGRNVAYHAIMNEEKIYGATIHFMDKNFDSGSIIDCLFFSINENHNAGDLVEMSIQRCKTLFEYWIPILLKNDKLPCVPQQNKTYYKKMKINDFIELDEKIIKEIRAKSTKKHKPKIKIGQTVYEIRRIE